MVFGKERCHVWRICMKYLAFIFMTQRTLLGCRALLNYDLVLIGRRDSSIHTVGFFITEQLPRNDCCSCM